eukprot:CAMPEP_0172440120 /NCGR_PEP_ID=MMETSP1065-20121228/875_1 /TAXON_ID=265537 /ORGANISM="Amphiprora paludosa, Strain CCMP125" /LENGTH=348 /DNA_ID=CAMNT_0013188903 /DNA_START=111 /DNA_END=1157 /DNA_ORIENTATION=-
MAPRDDSTSFNATSAAATASEEHNIADIDKNIVDNSEQAKPSNEQVLNVAFFSFIGFLVVQAVFALIANSQSMLADSEAMSVDAITYLFNLCAERIKNRPPTEAELLLTPAVRRYRREMRRLYLEMVPPLISVLALVIITFFTLNEAYQTLFHPESDGGDEDDVSIPIMLFFSALNLLLDVVNVTCFARADMTFGLSVVKKENNMIVESLRGVEFHIPPSSSEDGDMESGGETSNLLKQINGSERNSGNRTNYGSAGAIIDDEAEGTLVNLNMCSAWTHVCADTLRSTAVLIAAGIATVFQSIDGGKADAIAAVVVSVIILVSIIPLMQGLVLTGFEIRYLTRNPPRE